MNKLSLNIICSIAEYLSPNQAIQISRINKKFKSALEKEMLWKFLCHKCFSFFSKNPTESWRDTFIRYFKASKGQSITAGIGHKRYGVEIVKEHITSHITAAYSLDDVIFTCEEAGECLAFFLYHSNIIFNSALEFDEDEKRKEPYFMINNHNSPNPIDKISYFSHSSKIALKTIFNQFLLFDCDYFNMRIRPFKVNHSMIDNHSIIYVGKITKKV